MKISTNMSDLHMWAAESAEMASHCEVTHNNNSTEKAFERAKIGTQCQALL